MQKKYGWSVKIVIDGSLFDANFSLMNKNQQTVRQWKEQCEINDRANLRKYHEILTNVNFVLANSSNPELRAFAQLIINISER
jgi:hypothetical protein